MSKYSEGITATDHGEVELIACGLDIQCEDIVYRWDYVDEKWTAHEVTVGDVIVKFAEKLIAGWVEV